MPPAFRLCATLVLVLLLLSSTVSANQQEPVAEEAVEPQIEAPDKVEVEPVAVDEDISDRLERIFSATGWFEAINVETEEGIVILEGLADDETHREWAERIAQRTSDVVAVVNQIDVKTPPVWDIDPAIMQMRELGRDMIRMLPLLVVGLFIVIISWFIAKVLTRLARSLAARRIDSELIQQVVSSVVAVLIMLIGVYIALKVSGLTRLAVTVLGGTGLIGLALGFAFRDIAENYLASILISLNRPFRVGDLIQLEGYTGFVRRVTTRGTLLLTIEGNHVQIPNNTVYKAVITNFSSSPRIRKEFRVGIGYDDSITAAQEVILAVLKENQSVLPDPTPLVLVDSLGSATVNLAVFFWLDAKRFDALSVCSSLMRQTKTALTEANISMPDEAREVVFPKGVPIVSSAEQLAEMGSTELKKSGAEAGERAARIDPDDKAESTQAEGELRNIDGTIQRHAAETEDETDENLIK
ncbi:MAG: mechanosensitive ion channel protein MscS [Planctomyces sp.]|nr:mechanosensitive ion channel protein MscS [Planctomyces sp.]